MAATSASVKPSLGSTEPPPEPDGAPPPEPDGASPPEPPPEPALGSGSVSSVPPEHATRTQHTTAHAIFVRMSHLQGEERARRATAVYWIRGVGGGDTQL